MQPSAIFYTIMAQNLKCFIICWKCPDKKREDWKVDLTRARDACYWAVLLSKHKGMEHVTQSSVRLCNFPRPWRCTVSNTERTDKMSIYYVMYTGNKCETETVWNEVSCTLPLLGSLLWRHTDRQHPDSLSVVKHLGVVIFIPQHSSCILCIFSHEFGQLKLLLFLIKVCSSLCVTAPKGAKAEKLAQMISLSLASVGPADCTALKVKGSPHLTIKLITKIN